ncbi:MAG TPA: hypothetical protein VFN13_00855 [Rudaea sp.]|nr:hypothetical protein [Rudaea sp.]
MATSKATKRGTAKQRTTLSSHIANMTSEVHSGVVRALAAATSGGSLPVAPTIMANSSLGPHVNPKTVYVTLTFQIDLS